MLKKVTITLTMTAFILGQWGFTLLFNDRIIKWKKEKDETIIGKMNDTTKSRE